MTWIVRHATVGDKAALSNFECDSGADCVCAPQGGNVHESDVEAYLKSQALDAMEWRQPHNDHRLLLLMDPEGRLAGAVAHEELELLVEGTEVAARRLVVIGLRRDLQGRWMADHRLSSHLLAAGVHDLAIEPPKFLVARVMTCNTRSRNLLARHRIEMEVSHRDPAYIDLVGLYDRVVESLPPPLWGMT
ncbi:hypothetical protein A5714_02340 [Mycobacterium sp. E2462]|uniref:hypothetical protein n=1 Tax=Mycobacterium sp. E2462 TaxID=1834133 RepID=UPI0007FF4033|nr:hypothetical protein [Mycobacterium sp. E2462]OBI06579.1 hypothetical protein A5714_02340 [Mycobacterium sp. E2462]